MAFFKEGDNVYILTATGDNGFMVEKGLITGMDNDRFFVIDLGYDTNDRIPYKDADLYEGILFHTKEEAINYMTENWDKITKNEYGL